MKNDEKKTGAVSKGKKLGGGVAWSHTSL